MKMILLIEDNIEFAEKCVEFLLKNKYQVIYSNNAEKAKMEIINRSIDIALIDLMLPPSYNIEGLNLFRFIKEKNKKIKVVFMTSKEFQTTEIVAEAMKLGAKDFLDKNSEVFYDKLLFVLSEIFVKIENNMDTNQTQNTIYFSYAWGDKNELNKSREEIINLLYNTLQTKNYNLKRDKMDLGYRGLISEFMNEIGKGNLIIVAISDKYLKSPYCMFELYEIYRNSKLDKKAFSNRIFPIHLEYINLNDPIKLDEYYTYWEEKEKAWSILIQKRMDKIGKEQFAEYDKVKQIYSKFGDLTSFIMDMNALTLDLLSDNNFKKMIEAIDYKLNNE